MDIYFFGGGWPEARWIWGGYFLGGVWPEADEGLGGESLMRQRKESSKFKLFCFGEGEGWAGWAYDGEMHLFPMHILSVPPCCVSFGVLRRVVVTWLIRVKSEGEGEDEAVRWVMSERLAHVIAVSKCRGHACMAGRGHGHLHISCEM